MARVEVDQFLPFRDDQGLGGQALPSTQDVYRVTVSKSTASNRSETLQVERPVRHQVISHKLPLDQSNPKICARFTLVAAVLPVPE